MEEKLEEMEDVENSSSYSIIDDELSTSEQDDEEHHEAPLTEEEIEELIAELLEVESKAAEAQESLEDESLAKIEAEVREELAQSLSGDDLEKAIADEMETLKEEWEAVLDELETESAHLLEQLDGAGIELPSLYKWIESQAPNGCCTEAWKKRAHWVGSQVTCDITESITDAEKYLQAHRPVRRRHGRIIEEGASGFLGRKLATDDTREDSTEKSDVDWSSFNKIFSDGSSMGNVSFGSKHWASIYLASTPQQAAQLGLKFPGVDEVEEIDDIEGSSLDPFIADAIVNESELNLTEEQKRNFRKVKEEDDADIDWKLQVCLKRRRDRKRNKKEAMEKEVSSFDQVTRGDLNSTLFSDVCAHPLSGENSLGNLEDVANNENDFACQNLKSDARESNESFNELDKGKLVNNQALVFSASGLSEYDQQKGFKRPHETNDLDIENKKCRAISSESDEESQNEDDSVADVSPPAQSSNVNLLCTACDKLATEVHSHPLLKVIVCKDCKSLMEAKVLVKDPDCLECYCGWCGRNSNLVTCKSCSTLFCTVCIKRNLGGECLSKVQASGWQCCCCCPSILQKLTSQLEAIVSIDSVASSLDCDSDSSDSSDTDVHVVISSKRRQKKKIRRILDDTELGEETKKKIAIEKERQEHLKSLEEKFSTKSMLMSSGINGNLSEGGTAEMLGDAVTGYIVNVVREEGEEAVRIPPSISAKLKAHQVAGIRFMWQNIIQSIRKVKSGDRGLGCILAHTMGLGKTFQVIAFLYAAMRSVDLGLKTALIVTPVSVLHNWRHEFMKWRPVELKRLHVFMLEDVPRERRAEWLGKWRSKGGVFLIGYTSFRSLSLGKHVKDRSMAREICHALQDVPDILVCDEAHMIKNTRADVTQALKQVKCQRRIALTGSPLQNNLMEYYCMVDFVREGFLGSSHEFRNRFQNPIENGQHTNSTMEDVKIMNQRSHILYEQLKGFVQRMDMNVVKKDLPPKTVYVIAVKLSPIQRKLYKRFLDVHGFANKRVSNEKVQKRCFFAGYQALAQIWNHPGILQFKGEDKDYGKREDIVENFLADDSSSDDNTDYNMGTGDKQKNRNEFPQRKNDGSFIQEGWWNDLLQQDNYKEVNYSGKMILLVDILTMCSDMGDKVLVFSQSLSTLDLIEFYLSRLTRPGKKGKCWKQGKDWYRLDGRTEASERQKLVERFNEPLNRRVKCILISTKAGSLGINLHAANRVIIVDGSWNPTYDLQAIYRVWRYGQVKPVFAYRLMAHGTMEEKIYKRQVTKEGLAARVVDRQQVHRTISKEEMLHLFDFSDDENPDTLPGLGMGNGHVVKDNITGQNGNFLKQKLPLSHGSSSDKLMENLIGRHCPRWIVNYHEHESLLQENEDEKLSKEEQDMAWEVYQRTLEWEEVQRVPVDESAFERKTVQQIPVQESGYEQTPSVSSTLPALKSDNFRRSIGSSRNRFVQRKCTNLSHLLTLRSLGTKEGCSTVCGECSQEISWGDLHGDGRSIR